jgi:tetratricopeptide (TPR) repeat protein
VRSFPVKRLLFLLLPAAFLAGCGAASNGPSPAQTAAAQAQVDRDQPPASLRAQYMDLLTSGDREYVVLAMRLGLDAIRQGDYDFAARVFDQAIRRVEALQAGSDQADRAQSKFVAEQEKWFKGESYERAALYLYRGLLYLQAGDFGNAAACAKRTQIEDISSHEEAQGDWYSAEWLLAYASLLQGDPGTARDALARADKFYSKQGPVPPPDPKWNVVIVAEAGQGPLKTRRGRYGEELVIVDRGVRTVRLSIQTPDGAPRVTAAAENIYHQASTRGERKVDHILAGKAVFKQSTDIAGDAAIAAGAGTAMTSRSETQSLVGLGLIVGGVVTKAVSGASKPQADIRAWDNLPDAVFLSGLHCPVGTTKITIDALDAAGGVVSSTTREVTVTADNNRTPGVLWLRFP